jgi:hypothetical protein
VKTGAKNQAEDSCSAEYDSKSSLAHVRNVLNIIFHMQHSIKFKQFIAIY